MNILPHALEENRAEDFSPGISERFLVKLLISDNLNMDFFSAADDIPVSWLN
jgi:hypothetical protein